MNRRHLLTYLGAAAITAAAVVVWRWVVGLLEIVDRLTDLP